eukprot:CAMPEP_0179183570 /NCGR_PEP_ID=MMETSP0796-20121207/90978_1 /TAXON_ID=73915 /ORGANISM="Pyrodinium bahamense, Strain pbaha01" /LENGTH=333 /DNA_ID=CAMNT_0020887445 /DNA_START=40 /DNA_END=1039 /DNA_ORIENTATION=-
MERSVLRQKLEQEEYEIAELKVQLHEAAFFGQDLLQKNEKLQHDIAQLNNHNENRKASATNKCADKLLTVWDSRKEKTLRRSTFCEHRDSVKPLKRRSLLGVRAAEWDEELQELLRENTALRQKVVFLEHEEQIHIEGTLQERQQQWEEEARKREEHQRFRMQERERAVSEERELLWNEWEQSEQRYVALQRREATLARSEQSNMQRHAKMLGHENSELKHREAILQCEVARLKSECDEHNRIRQELLSLSALQVSEQGPEDFGPSDPVTVEGADALAKELGIRDDLDVVELGQPGWVRDLQDQLDHLREQLVVAKALHIEAEEWLQEERESP